jgi:predicted Zn-dependent peptidase
MELSIMKKIRSCLFLFAIFLSFAVATGVFATSTESPINIDVKEFKLDNGMLFLVVERPATPQIACRLAIRAGSALESTGQTGIAHMLAHMLFKGTKNFGTLNWEEDRRLQAEIESIYQVIAQERQKRKPNQALIQEKKEALAPLSSQVQKIYVPQAFSSQLGKNGAVGVNAFTSRDQTQYVMSVPSDMVEQWFSITSEQIFEPAFRKFYVEKDVIQREWAFRYVNNPGGAAWQDLFSSAYSAHPYRNPVIGWEADIENFSTTAARAFHQRYYNPTNAVCVLVGDITVDKARQLAEIYFSRYPAGRHAPESVTTEPTQQGPREQIRYLKGARTPLIRIGFHGASMGTSDFFALDALTMILSHGRGARLTREIVDTGLAAEAWTYNPDNRFGGMIIMGGSPVEDSIVSPENPDEKQKQRTYLAACRKIEKLLLAQVEKLKTEPVSSRDLDRIKKLNRRDFIDRLRGNESLAGTLATLEVEIGWRYLTEYLEQMDKVTPTMIQAAAGKYLRDDNRTTVFVIPGGKPDRPPEPYAEIRSVSGASAAKLKQPTDLTNHSIYSTPDEWRHPMSFHRQPVKIEFPHAETATIKGTRVFYLPDRELPVIDLSLFVKTGAVDVPDAQTGLDDLLSETVVRGGTDDLSPHELALVLDENAIHLSVSIDEESSAVHLSVLKDDWEKGLSLLKSVLTQPRFDQEVVQTTKQRMLTTLKRQGGSAESVVQREWLIWHFKGHPYGRDPLTGLQTIPAITRNDLKAFLNHHFVPTNMVAAVSGDISKAKSLQGLTRLLDSLPDKTAPRRNLDPPANTPPVLALVHKPGQVQSQVMLGMAGIRRTHPDFWKLRLLIDILGGNDSLLYRRLRDDLGLVYSTGFFQAYRWQAGLLMGYIGSRGDQTDQAIAETIGIIKALSKDVPGSDFNLKRLDALNSFVFNVDSPTALVSTYAHYFMREEPLDTLDRIQEQFISAQKEDMIRLAKTYLDTNQLQIMVVADKTITVIGSDGNQTTLENSLQQLAGRLGLPYREVPLR